MKIKSIFTIALLFTMLACDEDTVSPGKTSLLTLTVDASYTEDSDDWIIVHSEDGALLASESFEPNQQLEIVTDKPVPGKIMVTHLRYITWDGNKDYRATSHANIETGKHIVIKGFNPTPELTGDLHVTVSNVNLLDYYSLTSRFGATSDAGWSSGTDVLSIHKDTYAGASKYIVTVSDGTSLKYKVLNNVQPNDSYSFSFNDMDPFDQKVSFTFPESDNVNLFVTGSEPDVMLTPNEYMLMMRFSSDTPTTIEAGYLNNILTNYKTQLIIGYPGFMYQYTNIGSIPDGEVAWPQKSDFNIVEKSLKKFSATTSKSYVWRLSVWGYNDATNKTYVTWNISSSSGHQLVEELPYEITSVHPALSFNNLNHSSTTFYTQSPAFESFVNSNFEAGSEPAGLRLGIQIITN